MRGIAYSRRTLHAFVALPETECLVAEAAGEIVAFIMTEAEGLRAHIITIDVVEAHRRGGLGSVLLAEAEQRLITRGVRQVELETAQDNAAAVAFWHARGYRTRGVLKNYYLGRIDAFYMDKALPAPTEKP